MELWTIITILIENDILSNHQCQPLFLFIKLCNDIRHVRPDATFGADFICGFPTETEEQFQNTIRLVQEAKISKLHVFPYSERPGTPAALMPQVPVEIRKQRAQILRQYGEISDD